MCICVCVCARARARTWRQFAVDGLTSFPHEVKLKGVLVIYKQLISTLHFKTNNPNTTRTCQNKTKEQLVFHYRTNDYPFTFVVNFWLGTDRCLCCQSQLQYLCPSYQPSWFLEIQQKCTFMELNSFYKLLELLWLILRLPTL